MKLPAAESASIAAGAYAALGHAGYPATLRKP